MLSQAGFVAGDTLSRLVGKKTADHDERDQHGGGQSLSLRRDCSRWAACDTLNLSDERLSINPTTTLNAASRGVAL
jgi:hypothetical protein